MNAATKATMTLLAAMLSMTACNGEVEPRATAEPQNEESVFDPMIDQVEKARQVEDAALQRKAELDEALEEAEGSTDEF
jgi:hypothetical protein